MFVLLSLLVLLVRSVVAATDYTSYVLPFLGTDGGGNMFPGPTRPFGVVKLGPDVGSALSGYASTGRISAFSMLHESGTGGSPKYGVIGQMAVVGNLSNPLADLSANRSRPDEAQVGYYKSSLASGASLELAATDHTGIYQYTFPASQAGQVVVDLSHVLTVAGDLGQNYVGGNLTLAADGHYEGSATYNHGWNRAPDWTVFFCGYFDRQAVSQRTFQGSGTSLHRFDSTNTTAGHDRQGAVFTFADTSVRSTVGISWISAAKACGFVHDEAPASLDFPSLVNASKEAWNQQVLSKVTTTDTNQTNLQLLYSSLYGMHLMPSNRTGENPLWTSSEPYYDDIYTLWDLFRSHMPLMQILQPEAHEEQMRSLIDIWRHDGYLPDGRSSNFNGKTEGGSNADNVLADAYVKGVRGAVDWQDGYRAMVKDAEVTPPNNNDPRAPDGSTKEGRGALPDWRQLGYISSRYTRAVSRALEYSANDFGLYQVAKGLGFAQDADRYLQSSRNWRNHWNANATSLGFSGFVAPRDGSGAFSAPFDPLSCNVTGGCYWRGAFFEGSPWEYSFDTHHDMSTLVGLCAGPERFVQKLDTLMRANGNPHGDPAFGKSIIDPGNEVSFGSPYLYHFAGRADLSVQRSRHIAQSYYDTSSSGLPGNSDAGAMQSWLLWNMIGLYPLTGQTTFLIGSPWLRNMTIDLGGGKQLSVTASGGDGSSAYQVQSLKVNGQDWRQNWLTWDDVFARGGRMDFVLGSEARNWSTGALPPSPAAGGTAAGAAGATAGSDRGRRVKIVAFAVFGSLFVIAVVGGGLLFWLRPWRRAREPLEEAGPEKSVAEQDAIPPLAVAGQDVKVPGEKGERAVDRGDEESVFSDVKH